MDEAHTLGAQITGEPVETLLKAEFRGDQLVVIAGDGRKFVIPPAQVDTALAARLAAAETAALAAATALAAAEPIAEAESTPAPARSPRRRGAGVAPIKSEIEE